MTRTEEIKDCEISLAIAKTRLVATAVDLERAQVAHRHAEIDFANHSERLGRLAYAAGQTGSAADGK